MVIETILTPLISQIKNPWQYICAGIVWSCIIYFNINKESLVPALLCAMGGAYIINGISKFIFDQIILYKRKDKILFNLLHMNAEEKAVIWHCFSYNIQTININGLYEGMSVWNSLSQKGIVLRPAGAHNINDLPMTIISPVWEIIEKIRKRFLRSI